MRVASSCPPFFLEKNMNTGGIIILSCIAACFMYIFYASYIRKLPSKMSLLSKIGKQADEIDTLKSVIKDYQDTNAEYLRECKEKMADKLIETHKNLHASLTYKREEYKINEESINILKEEIVKLEKENKSLSNKVKYLELMNKK